MHDIMFPMYQGARRQIELFELDKKGDESEEILQIVNGWREMVEGMEHSNPEYSNRYEREKRMTDSFTPEQIDWICWQIGEWYIEWKSRLIIDLNKGQHRLGIAKEQLKTMICGD